MDKYVPYVRKWIHRFRLEKLLEKDKKTRETVEILYRRNNREKIWMEIWCRRILACMLAVAASIVFFLLGYINVTSYDVVEDGRYLKGAGQEREVSFEARADTEEGTLGQQITVEVGERKAQDIAQTETAPVTEAAEPPSQEMVLAQIREAVEETVQEGRGNERIELPKEVEGMAVTYTNLPEKRDFSVFYLCLAVLVLMPFLWRKKQREQLQERESQLLLDYPELVNKVVLLLSAGLTVKGCFERIQGEYQRRLEEGGETRYIYEEVCVSCQEMKNGVAEHAAMEAFGKRCRQLPYLRFVSIINQNIRKGSEGLIGMLEVEAMEAFEKRKEAVKQLGEKAGTKLLLPMVLMLVVVMAIITIPAFMTM